jgi:hypothetical protein
MKVRLSTRLWRFAGEARHGDRLSLRGELILSAKSFCRKKVTNTGISEMLFQA